MGLKAQGGGGHARGATWCEFSFSEVKRGATWCEGVRARAHIMMRRPADLIRWIGERDEDGERGDPGERGGELGIEAAAATTSPLGVAAVLALTSAAATAAAGGCPSG